MPGSPNSPATIVRYGPITREEAIDKVKMERRESSSELRERIDGHPQQRNLAFWMAHVGMIYLWVVESEYRGFFKPEREANQNAVKDQESVLHEHQAVASHNESTNRSPREHESRAMLKLKWNWLALECMKISRAVLPHFVDNDHPGFSSSLQNRPLNSPADENLQHMLEIMETKIILFMAEQARYGDLNARNDLVRLLIMDGDCKPGYRFPTCTAKFAAEIIAKYGLVSERIYRPNPDNQNDRAKSRIKYWCPILQEDGYMSHWSHNRQSFHIAPKQLNMRGWVLAFAEPGNRLWWPTNGLFIDSNAGVSVQNLDFVIVPSGGPDSQELEIHVLNERDLKPFEYFQKGGEPCSRRLSFQGRKLAFKNSERPVRKALYFQWLLAVLKWIIDLEGDGLDSKLAREELSRHDEIWGTSGEYVRQELLEALAEKSGIDIPITNAIPSGRVSDVDMAEILAEGIYDRERIFYRSCPSKEKWHWPRVPASRGSEEYARRIMESIDHLSEETSIVAERICKGEIYDDHDGYDRYFENDPEGYDNVFEAIHEEEFDPEMYDFINDL